MGGVGPLLAPQVGLGIAALAVGDGVGFGQAGRIVVGRRELRLWLEALHRKPGFHQHAIDREVVLRQKRCARIAAITLRGISVVSSRSPFFGKTVGPPTGSPTPRPTNQRNRRLYAICSISCRSERIEHKIWIRLAQISRSGAIEGRPKSV
jgi:hypothetical protein